MSSNDEWMTCSNYFLLLFRLNIYLHYIYARKKREPRRWISCPSRHIYAMSYLWWEPRKTLRRPRSSRLLSNLPDAKRWIVCNICKHLCWCSNISWFEAADGRMISRTTSERAKNIFQMKWNFEQRKKVLVCTRYEATDKTPNYRLV